jgi:hypothetical protein
MAVSCGPVPQNMRALARANEVRLARAELKHEVASGERTVADVILEPPDSALTMTVADLLMSQHRWGRTRTRRFLATMPLSETKQVGAMTGRQRQQFAARMRGEPVTDPYAQMMGVLNVHDVTPEPTPPKADRRCRLCRAGPGEPCMQIRRNATSLTITDQPMRGFHADR